MTRLSMIGSVHGGSFVNSMQSLRDTVPHHMSAHVEFAHLVKLVLVLVLVLVVLLLLQRGFVALCLMPLPIRKYSQGSKPAKLCVKRIMKKVPTRWLH